MLHKFSHRGANPLGYSKICLKGASKGYREAVLGDPLSPFSKVLVIGNVLGSTSGQTVKQPLLNSVLIAESQNMKVHE